MAGQLRGDGVRRRGISLLVLALAASLTVASPATAAPTGSIVFVKDHNVWIMAATDPSTARPVTTDGSAATPYLSPTQDDFGRILAVVGGEGGDLVRMDQQGNRLGAPFRPGGIGGNFLDLDLRADGEIFSHTTYRSYDAGAGQFVVAPTVAFAYADGRDSSAIATPAFDELYATFSTNRAVLTSYTDDLEPTVATYAPGDSAVQDWFQPCDVDQTEAADFGFCFPEYADVSAAQSRLVIGLPALDYIPVGARLWVFDMSAPAPAVPTWGCELVAPEPDSLDEAAFSNPEWSPDGSALVYAYSAEPADSLANGIYLATGFDEDCEAAFDSAQLVVPGGSYPDWSPAPLGASPDPTDPGPTDPGPGPTDPTHPVGAFDGDPATTERINASDPIAAAVQISRARFSDDDAARVVLSRNDAFPDSLAGATLTGDGPLLFTPTGSLHQQTRLEIERVLPAGGTVHVLGGVAAVSQAVEDQLSAAGYAVDRLEGPSRVETAIAVADRVRQLRPGDARVALARSAGPTGTPSAGWADSVTGGGWAAATGVPILVTQTAGLHPAVAAWLATDRPTSTVMLGGTAALAPAVESAVPSPRRIAGDERTGTAAAIATQLWGADGEGPRRFAVIDGFHDAGWAFGLAAGGMAADAGAPLLMVNRDLVPSPTAGLVTGCREVDLVLVGSGNVVTHAAAVDLDARDASC